MTTHYVLRPGWVVGIAWLFTSLICPWLPDGWRIAALVTAAVVAVVTLSVPSIRRFHAIGWISVSCLLAIGAFQVAYHSRVTPTASATDVPIQLEVKVIEVGQSVLLEVTDGDLPSGTRVRYYPSDAEVQPQLYDRFSSTFVLKPLQNTSDFSSLIQRASGVWLRAESVDEAALSQTISVGDVPWTDCFSRLRDTLTMPIRQQIDGDIAATVTGICLGADEQLSSAAVSSFRASGVSHLFAVSGLHMSVLVLGLVYVLRKLQVPLRWRSLCGIVFLLLFAATVGFSASVVRAAVVCGLMLFGNLLGREADARTSMGLALVLLLLIDPFAAYDAGLLLSFSATYGLVCWARPIQRVLLCGKEPKRFAKLWNSLSAAVAVALAAMLSTLPVLAMYFGRISLMTIPANLLTTLPAEVVLIAGSLGSVLSLMGLGAVSDGLFLVAGGAARFLLWVCEKISAFSLATVAIRASFLLLWLVGAYFVMALGRRFLSQWTQAALCGACVIILCVGVFCQRISLRDTMRVDVVSQDDDLAVVMTHNGVTLLAIAPSRAASLYGAQEALQQAGTSQIDVLMILGGEEPAVSYIPRMLATYLTDSTQVVYHHLPWDAPLNGVSLADHRVRLGENGLVCTTKGGGVLLLWDEREYLFYETQAEPTGITADAVFCAGKFPTWIAVEGELKPVKAQVETVVLRDGVWYITGE